MTCFFIVFAFASSASAQGPAPLRSIGDKCLDVLQANSQEGTPVVYFRCTGAANQIWDFSVDYFTNSWQIHGFGDLCLQPGPVGTSGFPEAVIGSCDDTNAYWRRLGSYPDRLQFRHSVTGQCLDVLGSSTDDLTPIVLFDCTGEPNQIWSYGVETTNTDAAPLVSIGDKCLDVLQADPTTGTPVIYFRCTGAENQGWSFFNAPGGAITISGLDGQCLRPGPIGSSGLPEAEIGPCSDSDAIWQRVDQGPDRFALRHVLTGQCLDVLGSNTADFTPIVLFDCTGAANQTWSFGTGGGGGGGGGGGCSNSSTNLCLQDARFEVEVEWRNFEGETGVGRRVFQEADSGVMYFFERGNWELLVKVLDGCVLNDHHWVFFAATTNVEFTLTITDTKDGVTRTWFNPLGRQADAITDTGAFATCP